MPTPRQPSLLPTVEKWISNAILDALRRPPITSKRGTPHHIVISGTRAPNGPPPIEHSRWHVGTVPPHAGLHLPRIGVQLPTPLLEEAQTCATNREWDALMHTVHHTRVERLYYVRQHHTTGWYAERNPEAGYAPGAALSILDLALRTEDERGKSLVIWGDDLETPGWK